MAGKGKRGRPAWIPSPEDIKQAEALAAQGLDEKDIATYLGICPQQLPGKKQGFPELAEAIKRGQTKGRAIIVNALFQGAKNGNVTSQIFWLKNKAGWRDKTETEHTGAVSVTVSRKMTDEELEAIIRGEA